MPCLLQCEPRCTLLACPCGSNVVHLQLPAACSVGRGCSVWTVQPRQRQHALIVCRVYSQRHVHLAHALHTSVPCLHDNQPFATVVVPFHDAAGKGG